MTELEKLRMVLRENAYDSLNESLAKAELASESSREWKFAILHIVHAIELLLKERLRLEHRLFVFQNVDKPGTPDDPGSSVSLEHALARLRRLGLEVHPSDDQAIRKAVEWRNKITHYEFDLFLHEIRPTYSLLFEFLHSFHLREIGGEILDRIEERHQLIAAQIMQVFREEFIEFNGVNVLRVWPHQFIEYQGVRTYELEGETFDRVLWGAESVWSADLPFPPGHVCHDCAAVWGQLHGPSCCVEECPRCHGQYISCECDGPDDADDVDEDTAKLKGLIPIEGVVDV